MPQARALYLREAGAVNRTQSAWDKAARHAPPNLATLRRLAVQARQAQESALRSLLNAKWPPSVAAAAHKVAAKDAGAVAIWTAVSKAHSVAAVNAAISQRVDSSAAIEILRLRLGLPPAA